MCLVAPVLGAASLDTPFSPWVWVDPPARPLSATWIHLAGDRIIAGGDGEPLSSADGGPWIRHLTVERLWNRLRTVVPANDLLVGAAGDVVVSSDGIHWRPVGLVGIDDEHITAVATNGDVLVAVGLWTCYNTGCPAFARAFVSSDGLSWTRVVVEQSEGNSWLDDVVWAGDRFLAIGNALYESLDGSSWRMVDQRHGDRLAWHDGHLVVDGAPIHGQISTRTPDGTWHEDLDLPRHLDGLRWQESRFVAVQSLGSEEGRLWTSVDGLTWRPSSRVPFGYVSDALIHDGRWIAVSPEGVASSEDEGQSWTIEGPRGELAPLRSVVCVASHGDIVVAGGWSATAHVVGSEFGRQWRRPANPLAGITSLAWAGDRFVAAADGGIWSSPDADHWQLEHSSNHHWSGMVCAESTCVALRRSDSGGTLLVGTDGHWQTTSTGDVGANRRLGGLAFGAGRWVLAVTRAGAGTGGEAVLVSADGTNWTLHELLEERLGGLVGNQEILLAQGLGGLLWSDDGINWNPVGIGVFGAPLWTGERFLVVGNGTVWVSEDGLDWSAVSGPGFTLWHLGRVSVTSSGDWIISVDEVGIRRSRRIVPDTPVLLPGLADQGGTSGSQWRSDIVLLDPYGEPGFTSLELLPRNDSPDHRAMVSIDPGATRTQRLERLPWSLFGFRGAASLRVQSWGQSSVLTGRTYHDTGHGTYGQAIPGFATQDAIACGDSGILVGLRHSDDSSFGFRSNLALANASTAEIPARVDLLAEDGVLLTELEFELTPGESIQLNDVLAGFPATEVAAAEVGCAAGTGHLVAYASVIDNRSHDPRLVTPAEVSRAGTPVFVPGAAHTEGVGSSYWKTDLALHAMSPGPARGWVEVIPWGESVASAQLPVEIEAGASVLLEDVVGTAGLLGGATLRVVVDQGAIAAEGHCYTEGSVGTYGQRLPALSATENAISARQVGLLPGLAQRPGWIRTNLGLVNLTSSATDVELTLRGVEAEVLGAATVHLPPNGSGQWNRIVRQLAGEEVELAWLEVRPLEADVSIIAYASVIDNRTHDPMLIVADAEAAPARAGGGRR